MFKTFTALLAALLLPMTAPAQSPRADPLDAQAATAPMVYRSSLATYKRLAAETPPLAWRDANRAVESAGGWRALAREANAPAAPSPQPAASAPVAQPRSPTPAASAPAHRH
jgi:hypothetical protein